MLPDEKTLTEEGLAPQGSGNTLLIACGALAREILALKAQNGWDHMVLQCLPAGYHHRPDKIVGAVEAMVQTRKHDFEHIFVVYADCGTGGLLEAKCAELGVEMIAGPHCFSFFEGNAAFEARGEITAFYLTDFAVRSFDAFIMRPLGLDKHPELLPLYFGNYEKCVYQAQTRDPALEAKARDCAARLGLPYEYRFTGYGDLSTALADLDGGASRGLTPPRRS